MESSGTNDMGGSYERCSMELLYLLIACFSVWKIVLFYNPHGGGRVITSFYSVIGITSLFRVICIFIEPDYLSGPHNVLAFVDPLWYNVALAEASQVLVSLMIFSIFILLVSFWSHMASKVSDREIAESRPLLRRPPQTTRRGPLEKFFLVMTAFFVVEIINFALFFLNFYDSSVLILYDSVVFGAMSLLLLIEVLVFSSRVRHILRTMAAINADSSSYQIRRIRAITVVNSLYLLVRFAAEAFSVYVFYSHWTGTNSVTFPIEDWMYYVRVKAWADAVVLLLQLLVAASSPPARKQTDMEKDDVESYGHPDQYSSIIDED